MATSTHARPIWAPNWLVYTGQTIRLNRPLIHKNPVGRKVEEYIDLKWPTSTNSCAGKTNNLTQTLEQITF